MKLILFIFIIGLFVILIMAGLLIPIEKYTTTGGCYDEPTPTIRLNLILGDSMTKIKNQKPSPNEGCSLNANYELFVL